MSSEDKCYCAWRRSEAWQAKKHEHALKLSDLQDDERVATRLREMYNPDTDWTNR